MKPSHIYNEASNRTYCGIEHNGTASGITRTEERYPMLRDNGEKFCKRCVRNMLSTHKRYGKPKEIVNTTDTYKQPLDYNGNPAGITFTGQTKLKIGDWIFNRRFGYISKVTSFDSNGIKYSSEIGAIDDCIKIERESERMEIIFHNYTRMFQTLKQIAGIYDWDEDAAGKLSIEILRKITGKMFP